MVQIVVSLMSDDSASSSDKITGIVVEAPKAVTRGLMDGRGTGDDACLATTGEVAGMAIPNALRKRSATC